MTTGPAPYYQDDRVTLWHGDCLDILPELPDNSADAVVTDPPYSLSFMAREWDSHPTPMSFQLWCMQWAGECLRILKPGGFLLAFGGTRTSHRLACAVEDAGFEIRDSIAWLYGSGFPKSLDVSKAIDRQRTEDLAPVDAVRSWLNQRRLDAGLSHDAVNKHFGHASNGGGSSSAWMTNPTSRSLPTWDQWLALKALFGFADDMDAEVWRLNGRKGKPGDNWDSREVIGKGAAGLGGGSNGAAYEGGFKVDYDLTAPATPEAEQWQGWGTALKPAHEPVVVARKPLSAGTVAANVLRWGTGALNIDAGRIGDEPLSAHGGGPSGAHRIYNGDKQRGQGIPPQEPGSNPRIGRWPANVALDESQAAALDQQGGEASYNPGKTFGSSSGGAIYGAGAGLPAGRDVFGYGDRGGASRFFYTAKASSDERITHNGVAHATVKPLSLMRWLVRLVTPPGGTILEPFAGSGSTVEAALLEGFRCIAIEREPDYLPLITQRINRRRDPIAYIKAAGEDLGLFGDDDDEPEAPSQPQGRWPANVVLDRSQAEALDQMSGELTSGGYPPEGGQRSHVATYGEPNERGEPRFGSSSGGASRFFKVVDDDFGGVA